ncbi:porin PorA family protein [Lawsonella clevelandensis]|uniref:Porin PorA n=1 Tax=Lawsonella clevelandensis TaxID=1528099 RepID=A0A0M4MCG5_9ACTN|nr:porin PorA family protein [Lawsonella clevelandensis]ALE19112.1 hypothetical protein AL705_05330 [Lawsonella clevelandensis]VHO00948.1 Porin PorA [Lawsonella clevelandensis]
MATPSDSPKKLLPSILAGVGAFLLVAGILLPTFLVPRLSIAPLAVGPGNSGNTHTTTTVEGTAFDPVAYRQQKPTAGNADRPECKQPNPATWRLPMFCFIDTRVPLSSRTTVFGAEPANDKVNTYQAGYTLWRKDRKTLEDGIITSYVDRVTTNRRTSAPTGESIIYPNADPANPGANDPIKPFQRTGYQYKFPYNTSLDSHYSYFDPFVLQSIPLTPVRETVVDGVKALEFKQVVGPTNLYKVWEKALRDDHGNLSFIDKLTLSAYRFNEPESVWKNGGSDQVVPYYAYYYKERDLVISQATGQILKKHEYFQWFAAKNEDAARSYLHDNGMRSGLDNPTVTLVEADTTLSKKDTEDVVADEKSTYALLQGATVGGWVMGGVGLILLVLGWFTVVKRTREWDRITRAVREDLPLDGDDDGAGHDSAGDDSAGDDNGNGTRAGDSTGDGEGTAR